MSRDSHDIRKNVGAKSVTSVTSRASQLSGRAGKIWQDSEKIQRCQGPDQENLASDKDAKRKKDEGERVPRAEAVNSRDNQAIMQSCFVPIVAPFSL